MLHAEATTTITGTGILAVVNGLAVGEQQRRHLQQQQQEEQQLVLLLWQLCGLSHAIDPRAYGRCGQLLSWVSCTMLQCIVSFCDVR
jgi:hypothetical protein